jgi:hypothetical protein
MIRFINCLKRRQDVSAEQFRKHWTDPKFTDLVNRMQAMFKAKRAARNLTLDVQANMLVRQRRGGGREPYDGVIEYWWDRASDLLEIAESAEAGALFEEMKTFQQRFVDFEASTGFFTEA